LLGLILPPSAVTISYTDAIDILTASCGKEMLRDASHPQDASNRRVQFINIGPR
jgi:hypothetical protein